MQFHGKLLHVREAGPGGGGTAVLLLHGQAFHSGTWEDLGTLAYLAQRGLRVVAVDVPGYGASEPADQDPATFLEQLLPALGLQRPVIVAPSMGGVFAFPYIARHAGDVAGFVGVAPAGYAEWATRLGASDVPALIVWGTADHVFPVGGADVLAAAFPNGRTLLLDGARHPAYLDRPQEFHAALAEFVAGLAGRR
jgi:abhydrolase domain-containing protein 14